MGLLHVGWGRTHGTGCVRQWFRTTEPLGERRYENWNTHTHTACWSIIILGQLLMPKSLMFTCRIFLYWPTLWFIFRYGVEKYHSSTGFSKYYPDALKPDYVAASSRVLFTRDTFELMCEAGYSMFLIYGIDLFHIVISLSLAARYLARLPKHFGGLSFGVSLWIKWGAFLLPVSRRGKLDIVKNFLCWWL